MTKMYDFDCSGCSVELVDQQISLRDFIERCPLEPEIKKRKRWLRVIARGGNCALNQTVLKDDALVAKDTVAGVDE